MIPERTYGEFLRAKAQARKQGMPSLFDVLDVAA